MLTSFSDDEALFGAIMALRRGEEPEDPGGTARLRTIRRRR
jgi:hypothetical protein